MHPRTIVVLTTANMASPTDSVFNNSQLPPTEVPYSSLTWEQLEEAWRRDDANAFEMLLQETRHDIDICVGGYPDDLIGLGIVDCRAAACMQRALQLGLHLERDSNGYTALTQAADREGRGAMVELLADADANLLGEFNFNDETPLSIATFKMLVQLKAHNSVARGWWNDVMARHRALRGRPHSSPWEVMPHFIESGAINPHTVLALAEALPAALLDTVNTLLDGVISEFSIRDHMRPLRALLRKHAITQRHPTDQQMQLLLATRSTLPVRCARLTPLVHAPTQPLSDIQLAARLLEYNVLLEDNDENELAEPARFPFLLCQWRGLHFYRHYYNYMQREEYVRCSHLNRLAPAPAVFVKAGVAVGLSQLMRESAAERAVGVIRHLYHNFGQDGRQRAYWDNSLTFRSTRDMLMYRSTTDLSAFTADVSSTARHASLRWLNQADVRGNPTCATSEVPHQAVRYALGLKAFAAVKPHRLRPQYSASGVPAHPTLGKVFVALLAPHEMAEEHVLHVSEAHNERRFELDMRFVNERESGALGGFSKGKFFYEHAIHCPRLDGRKMTREARSLGTDKQTIERWTRQLHDARAMGARAVVDFEDGLLKEMVALVQVQLYEVVREESERRGCRLVYRAGNRRYAAVPQPLRQTHQTNHIYTRDDNEFVQLIGLRR